MVRGVLQADELRATVGDDTHRAVLVDADEPEDPARTWLSMSSFKPAISLRRFSSKGSIDFSFPLFSQQNNIFYRYVYQGKNTFVGQR